MRLVMLIEFSLFLYHLFVFGFRGYEGTILWCDSYADFRVSFDKLAISSIIFICAINWVLYMFHLIATNKSQNEKKAKNRTLIVCGSLEFVCISLAIFQSKLVYSNKATTIPNLWVYVVILNLLIVFIAYILYPKNSKTIKNKNVNSKNDSNIIVVILAGGKNMRLKMLTETLVKFLDILVDGESLLESTISRHSTLAKKQIVISTERYRSWFAYNKNFRSMIQQGENTTIENASASNHPTSSKYHDIMMAKSKFNNNHPKQFCIEPCGKGTATAIFFYLWLSQHESTYDCTNDPVIVITPADLLIQYKINYSKAVKGACDLARKSDAIFIFGISPRFISTQFGYICATKKASSVLKVENYIAQRKFEDVCELKNNQVVLWNSGITVAKRSVLYNAFDMYWENAKQFPSNNASQVDICEVYENCSESSFDEDILEKVENLFVMPVSFDWIDVGDPQRLQSAICEGLCTIAHPTWTTENN